MDPERSRVQSDLRGILDGEIRCDELFLQLYSSDASIHQIRPLGVVRPAHTEDVVRVVNYARENQIPIHPRGSGSNVVGGCLGRGLVLDFSYQMRRVIAVGRDSVTVQPGIVLAVLNRELQSHGVFFGPDPATRSITTIGGTLALNLSGSHWVRYGEPRDHVLSMEVVLASGEVVQLDSRRHPDWANRSNFGMLNGPSSISQIHNRLYGLLNSRAALLEQHRPQTAINQAGYHVYDLAHGNRLDLTRLMVGSEGTLGVITQVELSTDPIPRHRGVALLFFERLETAAKSAVEIHGMGVSACDLLDRRLLSLVRESSPELQRLIPLATEAMLLCEYQADDDASLREKLDALTTRICRRNRWATDFRITTQVSERNLFWKITRRVTPSLFRMKGNRRAVPFVEDLAVSPQRLPEFVAAIHQVLNSHEVTASLFSHTPQGLVQIHPFLDLADPQEHRLMQRLASDLYEKTQEFQGTISGGFGDGLSRTWFLRRQFGPLYGTFVDIKNLFDADYVLNPGKVVDHPPMGLVDQLRTLPTATAASSPETKPEPQSSLPVVTPQLQWPPDQMSWTARSCNGCGRCRTVAPEQRMCPIYRNLPREEASPRAKANLMRAVLAGDIPTTEMATDEFKQIADLCVNCHQCRLECPAGVDIPKLMVEAKAQYVAVNGLSVSDWLLSRLDLMYEFAGRMPSLTNFLIQNRTARWIIDRMFGIAQGRKLPRFDQRSFLRWAYRRGLHRGNRQNSRKVVFFVDAFVNRNDVELGKALVLVLQRNGVDVLVPQDQNVSGMSLISDGVLNRARKLAAKNVELLAEYVRQGYQIITTEPSAALALKWEYLNLIDDPDTQKVADQTFEACQYLWGLHQVGQLDLKFNPVNATIGYHTPCHLRALQNNPVSVQLLRLIPGLQVDVIEKGCSGLAGTFGLKRKNYKRSLRTGFGLINAVRESHIQAGSTECSTCRIQMEQGTSKPTIHPVKVLALAYDLMPELRDIFNRRSGELALS